MGKSNLNIVIGYEREPKVLLSPKSYRQEGRSWVKGLGLSFLSKGFILANHKKENHKRHPTLKTAIESQKSASCTFSQPAEHQL